MTRVGVLALLVVLLFGGAAVHADVLHLKSGGRFEGELVSETETEYVFRVKGLGVQRFAKKDVERLERGRSVFEEFERRRLKIPSGDAQAHYELGLWAKEQGLLKLARAEFVEAIEADPDHEGARAELGYVKVEGEWIDAEEHRKLEEKRRREEAAAAAREKDARLSEAWKFRTGLFEIPDTGCVAGAEVWFWTWKDARTLPLPPRGLRVLGPELQGSRAVLEVRIRPESEPAVREAIASEMLAAHPGATARGAVDLAVEEKAVRFSEYEFREEESSRVRWDGVLDRGADRLQLTYEGPAEQRDALFESLSDIASSFSFEPPPKVPAGSRILDRLPGPGWEATEPRQFTSQSQSRMYIHAESLASIHTSVTRWPGASVGTLQVFARSWLERNGQKLDWRRIRERRIGGRTGIVVPFERKRSVGRSVIEEKGLVAMVRKGNVVVEVNVQNSRISLPGKEMTAAELASAFGAYLDSIRFR